MKRTNTRTTILVCSFILIIIAVTSAFTYRSVKKEPKTDWTNYYWFSTSGVYLRQNIVDDEIDLTGFDEFSYAPFTLRERGYTPANVNGNPPAPINSNNVSIRLYSHP